MSKRTFSTPMMQQFMSIKNQYPDALLFFRLGDFYELFLDDAKLGADVLNITLTKRPRGKDGYIPMAGVPYHVADTYVARLVKAGHKVAICEQVSEPTGKGIVEREVVRVVTPGTLLDEKNLDKRNHNYIMSIYRKGSTLALAVVDLSTGDFQVTEIDTKDSLDVTLSTELARFGPTECVLNNDHYNDHEILKILNRHKDLSIFPYYRWDDLADNANELLKSHFGVYTLSGFGIKGKKYALKVAASLIGYLQETQKNDITHIRTLKTYTPEEAVVIDRSTMKNLELFQTIHEGKRENTFLELVDSTATPMGARKLRSWVKRPLVRKAAITKRLTSVEELIQKDQIRSEIQNIMKHIYDIERILSRLSVGVGNPVDLIHLSESLALTIEVKGMLMELKSPLLKKSRTEISSKIKTLTNHVDSFLVDDPPFDSKSGGLFREGVDKKLDSLRSRISGSKTWIARLEEKEKKRTGIPSLKVRFNKVFGYYIEISKTYLDKIPNDYIRKQTLVNAERYITTSLKKHEDKVLKTEDKIHAHEHQLFLKLIKVVLTYTTDLQKTAQALSTIDCLISFANVAERYRYTKPTITTKDTLQIIEGRHPVVEKVLGKTFVPNGTTLDNNNNQMIIITGPNMAGKSVYMRQVAIITLMAHCGMFVPAKKATIPMIDRLFVRSGAADVITEGLSTFMLEMVETAHILTHATNKSLIIMDEVGRGTSTYDGISIAWAVVEYLVTNKKKSAKTLFATHYHELTGLEKAFPKKVKNYSMAIEEKKGKPIFLYLFSRGGASSSYGIAVADLAGVPHEIVSSATKRLSKLENNHTLINNHKPRSEYGNDLVIKKLDEIDIEMTTPIEAISKLAELKKSIYDKNS